MSLYPRNALRPVAVNRDQASVNLQMKPIASFKNILGLPGDNINALKQQAARDMAKPAFSKIPVFRSTRNLISQKENVPAHVPGATLGPKKVLVAKLAKAATGPVPVTMKAEPQVEPKVEPTKKPIENIDMDNNCFLLSDYAPDIYAYLREVEERQKLEPNFLAIKGSVAPHMRSILINWLTNVHISFQLCSETFYIAVSLIDRYMAREAVPKGRIQLVGITSLFIASKFEEIYYPEISEFVNVCDKLYTKRDIIKMELEMLGKLNFELGRPLPAHFLRRGSKAAHADGRTHMLAKYLCELSLVDYDTAHWNPSLLAATALYISLRLIELERSTSLTTLDQDTVWTPTIEHYTGYLHSTVVKHAAVLCRCLVNAETSKQQAVRTKYRGHKFLEISKAAILSHKLVKRLANSAPPSIVSK